MINLILSKLNLKLTRYYNGTKSIPVINNNQRVLIELIGQPASGITTLMNLIKKEHSLQALQKHFNLSKKSFGLPTKFTDDYERILSKKINEVSDRNIESYKKVILFNSLLEIVQVDYFLKELEQRKTLLQMKG